MNARANAFDLMRIGAALMVLFSHQLALTGRAEWAIDGWQSLGGVGLLVFFSMSGFLVCDSWSRDPNVWRFAARRLLRLWPALFVVVTLSACVLGPAMTTLAPIDYFRDPTTSHYFGILRFNDAGRLPGVFEGNPIAVVNGSLWTLPIELRWYEYLAAAGVLGIVRWRWILLAITLWMAIDYFVVFDVQHAMQAGIERRWKQELGLYFLAGACLQRFLPWWSASPLAFALGLAAVGGALFAVGYHHFAYWLWLPPATIALARRPVPAGAERMGREDWSYGVYIYAFPVQQTLIALSGNAWPFAVELAASTAITLACACASWRLIERPALRWKPRVPPRPRASGKRLSDWAIRTFGWR